MAPDEKTGVKKERMRGQMQCKRGRNVHHIFRRIWEKNNVDIEIDTQKKIPETSHYYDIHFSYQPEKRISNPLNLSSGHATWHSPMNSTKEEKSHYRLEEPRI